MGAWKSKGESARCTSGLNSNHYLKLLKGLYSCSRFSRYIHNFFSFFLSVLCWEFEWGIFFLLIFFCLVLINLTLDLIPCHYIWAKKPNIIINYMYYLCYQTTCTVWPSYHFGSQEHLWQLFRGKHKSTALTTFYI